MWFCVRIASDVDCMVLVAIQHVTTAEVATCNIKGITVGITQINEEQTSMKLDKHSSDGMRADFSRQQSSITHYLSCPEGLL